jgi:tetratricopeptide (TPR) repeat protein
LLVLDSILVQIYYHTLLIELVAKTLKNHKSLNINTLFKKLQEEGIKNKALQIEINTGAHAIMTNNEKKARINEYIQSIFDLNTLSVTDQKYLLYFSILPSVEIDFADLIKFFNITEYVENTFIESLNHTINNGWLQEKSKTYKMHPLIQAVIREKLKPDAENCKDIIVTFSDLLDYEPQESAISRQELIPYTENILSLIKKENKELAELNYNLAIIFRSLGNYEKALEYNLKDIEISEIILDPGHQELAKSYNDIALTYHYLGKYEKALDYHYLALKIREKLLDSEHLDLANSYNNIAGTYSSLGIYTKALEYQFKDLAIIEKKLEIYHPSKATSYNNIAETYRALGNYEKVMEYHKKSIVIREKTLVPDHPDLAISYNNIAGTYYDMKDYINAKFYIDKAVKIWKIALPADHPDLKSSLEWQKIINDALNNQ